MLYFMNDSESQFIIPNPRVHLYFRTLVPCGMIGVLKLQALYVVLLLGASREFDHYI